MSDDEQNSTTRRGVLAALVGGILYLAGMLTGSASADHGGGLGGDVASQSEPADHVWVDEMVLHERTSDPSSPDNGTMVYNSDP